MKILGKTVDQLKANFLEGAFNDSLSHRELITHTEAINTRIHTVTSNLLKQSVHPEIVSNVLFGSWLRILNLHASIGEAYHQKMEFYFTEVIDAARKQVPLLFQESR